MGKSLMDIMRMSQEERKVSYEAQGIDSVTINGQRFSNYGTFSFVWEKSYITSPARSGNGSIGNLDSYTTFILPHLKIHFDIISIDDYRALMSMDLQNNEFTVTNYDILFNKMTTNKMYFAPTELEKLYVLAHAIQSGGSYVELLGVEDFTVEMIGTESKQKEDLFPTKQEA